MCGPVEMAVAMGSLQALQVYGDTQRANAQVAAQEQMARNAYRNANEQMSALESQKNRAASSAVEKMTQDQLRAAQAASAARVSAGEAGIAGVGVNRIVGDIGQQLGQEGAITQRNLLMEQSNISAQQEGVQLGLEADIRKYQTPVDGPTPLGSILKIGMGALGGYNMATTMGLGSGLAMDTAGEVVSKDMSGWDFIKSYFTDSPEYVPVSKQFAAQLARGGEKITQAEGQLQFQRQVTGVMQNQYNTYNDFMTDYRKR